MTIRKVFGTVAVALSLILLASCEKGVKPPLVFGANVWPGYEPVYLARELGYLPAEQVRLAEYANASEVKQAFRSHAVHLAAVTLDEALQLRRDVPDLKIVLLFDASNGADAILAQRGINSMAQLQGRRVGVENTALGAYFLSLALQSSGMQTGQVDIIPLPVNEQESAFHAHKLDAVVTFEPVKTRLLAAGAQVVFDSSRVPGKILDVLVTRDEDIGNYHREMVQLVQGWRRALDYMHSEPAKATQAMAKREQLDPAQFDKAMQGLELFSVQHNRELMLGENPAISASIDAVQHVMLDKGLLSVGVEPAMLLDTSLIAGIAK